MIHSKFHFSFHRKLVLEAIKKYGAKEALTGFCGSDEEAVKAIKSDKRKYFVASTNCDKQKANGACAGHSA